MLWIIILLWIFFPLILSFYLVKTRTSSGRYELQKIKPGIWCYRGHFSNSFIFEFRNSLLIVDTQVSPKAAQKMLREIRKVSDLPITHIINTHHHGDHTGGNELFKNAQIIATDKTKEYCVSKDDHREVYANSFGLIYQEVHSIILPNKTFSGQYNFEIDGEEIQLIEGPAGETDDALFVYFPGRKAILVGDAVVARDFPFLGAPIFDEGLKKDGEWIKLLGKIKEFDAQILLPGHGPCLIGKSKIQRRLDLLINLFSDLFKFTEQAWNETKDIAQTQKMAQTSLEKYAKNSQLRDNVLGLEFGIYKALNTIIPDREGKGWWYDLMPNTIEEDEVSKSLIGDNKLGELAYYYFSKGAQFKIKVKGTQYWVLAQEIARKQLEANKDDPNALFVLGFFESFSSIFLCQDSSSGIEKLELALRSKKLLLKQKILGIMIIVRALQVDKGEKEAFQRFMNLIKFPLNIILIPFYPITRDILR